jgi:hypothetical protein
MVAAASVKKDIVPDKSCYGEVKAEMFAGLWCIKGVARHSAAMKSERRGSFVMENRRDWQVRMLAEEEDDIELLRYWHGKPIAVFRFRWPRVRQQINGCDDGEERFLKNKGCEKGEGEGEEGSVFVSVCPHTKMASVWRVESS